MSANEFKELFSDVIKQWRLADSQRMIFGVDMPQTQGAIEGLTAALEKVFKNLPAFSLVLKDQAMEIVVQGDKKGDDIDIPAHLPSLPKVFQSIKINSVTITSGITHEELKLFFTGISMKLEDIESEGGLKGYLKKQGVGHIKIDQMKFQLLKDGELVGGKGKGGGGVGVPKGAVSKKEHDSLWSEYLNGKINEGDFKDNHQDLISGAAEDPKQLEKLLKRLAKKQKETEKFIANLDQKLSEAGMNDETIAALKKKLTTPKKVMVSEDELARLEKIELEYKKGLEQRADETLDTIRAIKKKIKDERSRSEAMLHQLSHGGIVLDKKGKIISVNVSAQNVLGGTQEALVGKNIRDILKSHHLMTTVSDWQDETNDYIPKDVKAEALDEETMAIVRDSTIVIESEDGRSVGVIAALQDVTQHEDLSRRKNDILDVLGHDLRAPLGAIKQNFDVLVQSTRLSESCDERQKKFLDNCKNNITRMSRLIEKIMDMRQLETGKIMLKYDAVETNALIEQAVMSLTEWAQNKKIKLQVNAEKLPDIDGDPERLYQVITNLVSNALKFTPDGGTIKASGKLVKVKGVDHVQIAVEDSGMGIDKENLAQVFDKYRQVTANSPSGVSGLGLGLSICKAIIELHGGTISVASELKRGSTFTFQVPVKQSDDK